MQSIALMAGGIGGIGYLIKIAQLSLYLASANCVLVNTQAMASFSRWRILLLTVLVQRYDVLAI
jgi:hypothetical protein